VRLDVERRTQERKDARELEPNALQRQVHLVLSARGRSINVMKFPKSLAHGLKKCEKYCMNVFITASLTKTFRLEFDLLKTSYDGSLDFFVHSREKNLTAFEKYYESLDLLTVRGRQWLRALKVA
jgi:hypothetical protein